MTASSRLRLLAFAALLACATTPLRILERDEVGGLEVTAHLDSNPRTLEISGLAMHSALVVTGHRVEREGNVLVVLVSLALTEEGKSGSFRITIELPSDVDRVVFGERRKTIWPPFGGRISPVDLRRMTARQFLTLLEEGTEGQVTIESAVEGWPPASEIDYLLSQLDESRPCQGVAQSISSHISLKGSNVGQEAAYLLQGIRDGSYPPGLNSDRNTASKDELRAWAIWRRAH